MPRLTEEQREMYRAFTAEFSACWSCGWWGFPHRKWTRNELNRCHIFGGWARQKGTDRRNLLMLCYPCHRAQHGDRIVVREIKWPKLELPGMLWLKRHRDPEFYDTEFLQTLSIKRLPEPEKPDWIEI